MSRLTAKISWISAVAAFATLLAIQTLHSPLQHALECSHAHEHATHSHAGHRHSAHQHAGDPHHACCGKHSAERHNHSQAEASDPSLLAESGEPCDSHQHSHDCQLCQFLTQALQPVSAPILIVNGELLADRPAEIAESALLVALSAPHVRGPPQIA